MAVTGHDVARWSPGRTAATSTEKGTDMLPLNLIETRFRSLEGPLPLQGHRCANVRVPTTRPVALRRWLLDDAAPLVARDGVWAELILKARGASESETPTLLILGLALPGLRRAVNRAELQSPDSERTDLEAEAITGFLTAIHTVNLTRRAICSQLCQAAHSSARALGRSNRRQRHEPEELAEEPEHAEAGHIDLVLAGAVAAGVIDRYDAHLIGATRLDGEYLTAIARRTGLTSLAIGLRRRRAEERLHAWLKA
jgi:hypothetical protein